MKNLVAFAKSSNEKKFTINENSSHHKTVKHSRSLSFSTSKSKLPKDPFLEDISVSLQSFCFDYTEFKPGTRKVVHDCNSNNVSLPASPTTKDESFSKTPKLKRLRSWNKEFSKKLRELEENLPRADDRVDSLREKVRQSHIESTAKQQNQQQQQSNKQQKHNRTQSLSSPIENEEKDVFLTTSPVSSTSSSPENLGNRKSSLRRSSRRISTEFCQRFISKDPNQTTTTPTTGRRKISTPGPFRKLSTPGPLRKLSTPSLQRKSSEYNTNAASNFKQPQTEYIDFGACFSPDEMKTLNQVLDKLTSSIRNTNNTAHRRYSNISDTITHSLKEPAKKYLSTHSLKRRRKSHEFTSKKNGDLDSVDGGDSSSLNGIDSKSDSENSAFDLSLTRERLDKSAEEIDDLSFSKNIWFYGEFDIGCSSTSSYNSTDDNETAQYPQTGTIIARTDSYGDVIYSLTYTIGDELIPASFPCLNNRYCLDFSDPNQPRFTSAKYLIAFLIQQQFMERVTFQWLITNSPNFC